MVAELAPQHPILACADTITAALDDVVDVQPTYMRADDKRLALLALAKARRQLDELHLRLMAASGDVAEADGSRDVAAWLVAKAQADLRTARAEQRLAKAVEVTWQRVQASMAAGVVSGDQARVIIRTLDALAAEELVTPDLLARAEEDLVELAETHGPEDLRQLARFLLELIAPEIADAVLAKQLDREERFAEEKTKFTHRFNGDGTARGTLVVPEAVMRRFLTYLEAFTSPRKQPDAVSGEEDRIPHARKMGQAFCALLEHLDPQKLPEHGGDATTLLVTIDFDALCNELGVGQIVGGETISAHAIRRLACTAQIIPVVLGAQGEILDLGRARRIASPAQRKALALRDQRCRAEGCTIPARWCEAHHLKPWSEGGNTDLNDLVLGCSFHHHRLHDPRYTHEILPNGDIRFHRRT